MHLSEKPYSIILIVLTLLVIGMLVAFQYFHFIKHIGIYEFLSQFDLLMRNLLIPFFVGGIISFFPRYCISEEYCLSKMATRGPIAWLFSSIYGMLEVKSKKDIYAEALGLKRSGIYDSHVYVYILASYFFNIPLLCLVCFLFPLHIVGIYLMTIFLIVLFTGALGELLFSFHIFTKPDILVRSDVEIIRTMSWFRNRFKNMQWKDIFFCFFDHILRYIHIFYLPFIGAILFSALLVASLNVHLYNVILGDHFIAQLIVFFMNAIFPFFHYSAFIFGYSITLVNSALGTFFTTLSSALLWRYIFQKNYTKHYDIQFRWVFFILLSLVSLLVGYMLNLK